jgi:AcrR family transcriptional regulator
MFEKDGGASPEGSEGAGAGRDRRRERREATRAEILDAAWELVREEGLAALSMRDLARRVGMQAPSLYSYFASKHAIYDAMFAQGAMAFTEGQATIEATGDALTDLRRSMHFYVRFCMEDVPRYQLLFQRTIPGFEPSPESFALAVANLEEVRRRLALVGIDDPRALDLLTAIGTGLADQQISNDPGGDRWVRLIDDAMAMFHDHVLTTGGKR